MCSKSSSAMVFDYASTCLSAEIHRYSSIVPDTVDIVLQKMNSSCEKNTGKKLWTSKTNKPAKRCWYTEINSRHYPLLCISLALSLSFNERKLPRHHIWNEAYFPLFFFFFCKSKQTTVKVAALGQAIVQCARPEQTAAQWQVRLEVQCFRYVIRDL